MSKQPTVKANDRESLTKTRRGAVTIGLVVVASPVAGAIGHVVRVGRVPVTLQRLSDSFTEDDWMSREHATAWLDGGVVRIRDGAGGEGWKSSANGTQVGHLWLEAGAAELNVGDTVRTGRTLWMLIKNPRPSPSDTLLIGLSEALGRARDEISLVANQVAHRLKRGLRVTQALLVTGPRGTGKQVVAREVHRQLAHHRRPKKVPFRQVSAPSLADGTGAADLFGVVDRYATDVKARPGYFEQANGGVLLLDEVGDTPLPEQAKLLNVLEEREVTPLGGRTPLTFECLVVAATNKRLADLTASGEFRTDLIDRLGRFRIHLPPLDERREDIPFVAQRLLERHGFTAPLPWDVAQRLIERSWPGNVRELDAFLERMVAVAEASAQASLDIEAFEATQRRFADLQPPTAPHVRPPAAVTVSTSGQRQCPPRDELLARLEGAGWNKTEVGRQYGKHARQITRWMAYLGIQRPE